MKLVFSSPRQPGFTYTSIDQTRSGRRGVSEPLCAETSLFARRLLLVLRRNRRNTCG
jgi:hypothetical protein